MPESVKFLTAEKKTGSDQLPLNYLVRSNGDAAYKNRNFWCSFFLKKRTKNSGLHNFSHSSGHFY
jgi:hypothetical protein